MKTKLITLVAVILSFAFPASAKMFVTPSIAPYGGDLGPIPKHAETKQPLIWNPLHHPSGDSLRSVLTSAGFAPLITDSLDYFLNSLENYTLFIVAGIYEYYEPYIDSAMFHNYRSRLNAFLDNGGSIYWEGPMSLMMVNHAWFNRFHFDISNCYQYPSSYLCGDDTLFLGAIDSLGLDESGVVEGCFAISSRGALGGMDVLRTPESSPMTYCTFKAVAYSDGNYRTFVASYPFCRLHDYLCNTRVELITRIMDWLNGGSVIEETPPLPRLHLAQNYPNPFNNSTEIEYSLTASGKVSLDIFDVLGRRLATLIEEEKNPGIYRVSWNAENYPSGIYFAVLRAGDTKLVRKMTLLK